LAAMVSRVTEPEHGNSIYSSPFIRTLQQGLWLQPEKA
jgi:hypothetical protein